MGCFDLNTLNRGKWGKTVHLTLGLNLHLISEAFYPSIQQVKTEASYRSDHSPVVLTIKLNEFKRGRGLWKFNSSLLLDKVYVDRIKDCINKTKLEYICPVYNHLNICEIENSGIQFVISDQLFLETLLLNIRGQTISFATYKKSQRKLKQKELEQAILELEQNPLADPTEIIKSKLQLEIIRKEEMRGITLRSKVKWIEEGEKPSKYFCALEKKNFVNKTIPKVQRENGCMITNQQDILQETKLYYENLYRSKSQIPNNLKEQLMGININSLSDFQNLPLQGEITKPELASCLRKMKNNKSPGSDGFTIEFFKFFYKDIGDFVLRSVNEGFKTGELSSTQKEATLLPKGNCLSISLKIGDQYLY